AGALLSNKVTGCNRRSNAHELGRDLATGRRSARRLEAHMRTSTSIAALVACALVCAVVSAEEPRPIAIVHGTMIDGRGGPPVPDATLLIRGRVIEAAGAGSHVAVPKDAQVIDASGKTMMPGLADLHVHMQGGWDGDSMDLLGYQLFLNALLYAGVTTVLDTG